MSSLTHRAGGGRRRRGLRRFGLAGVLALAVGLGAAVPAADWVHRLGIDFMLAARHAVIGPLWAPSESEVVVIAIDEETYRTPPFADRPQVTWTPFLGTVIEAVAAANPAVIGLDIVYPTTLDQPDLLPGYDKAWFRALIKAGRPGKLVLGKLRLSQQEISPHPRQVAVVGGTENVRLTNVHIDPDQVVRRYPVGFPTEDGMFRTGFGMELARRAGGVVPATDFLINYNTGSEDMPEFSLADLLACAEAGRQDFFHRHFAGRVVLIGQVLDLEDRFLAAKRFAQERRDRTQQPRCMIPFDAASHGSLLDRRTIPGVYIHAAAINTVLKNAPLTAMPRWGVVLTVGLSTLVMVSIFFRLRPAVGLVAGLGVLGAEAMAALVALQAGLIVPLLGLAAAAVISFAVAYAYRFLVEDRAKRWIQHAFGHFLSPEMVRDLAENPDALRLGGTSRRVTVFFSDIAGFTTLSEQMAEQPERLVEILNKYLTVMTNTVEAHHGYVDKFIGDAVMAVWGAPLDDVMAERNAVNAALECQRALAAFNRDVIAKDYGLPPIGTRIGINTGVAVVGNMGSDTRLNYTVAGDTVNLSARLEGANKVYGSQIMIGESTASALGDDYSLRLLDLLVVKGKQVPVKVYEVLGLATQVDAATTKTVAAYHAALDLYFDRDFERAERAFAALADNDIPSALYRDRCRAFQSEPPGPDWDGRYELKSK